MKLSKNSNVLCISHNDMDGAGCMILLESIFQNIKCVTASYQDIDSTILTSDCDSYDAVFITDIYPIDATVLDDFDNIILLDHHETATPNNAKRHYVNRKFSATYLVKVYLEKVFGAGCLNKYTKLVEYINDYDMWHHNFKHSIYLNYLYGHYGNVRFRERYKDGVLTPTASEKIFINKMIGIFEKDYQELDITEFKNINACAFCYDGYYFVNELCHRLMNEMGYKMVFFTTSKSYNISVRSQVESLNVGDFLRRTFKTAGGHRHAGGINGNSETDRLEVLKVLDDELYKYCVELRKDD